MLQHLQPRHIGPNVRQLISGLLAEHIAAADPHPGYLTQAEADLLYSALAHTHDDRYYTEAEIDALFAAFEDDDGQRLIKTSIATGTVYTIPASKQYLVHGRLTIEGTGRLVCDSGRLVVIGKEDRGSTDSYTEAEVDALLALKSDTSHNHDAAYSALGHTHDDRYFTEAEVTASLAGKSDTGHTHDDRYFTEAEVTASLAGKSDVGHTHDTSYAKWVTSTKAADENRVSTTALAADASLQFAMAASGKYRFRARIYFDSDVTPDFKYRHAGSAAATLVRIHRRHILPGTATITEAVDTAYSAADIVMLSSATNGGYIEMDGIVHNDSGASTFSFQWAPNTLSPNSCIVRAGSFLEYLQIA